MSFVISEIEERKLEAEIIENPGAIEKGLVVLDHQVPAGTRKVDILAVDSENIITIIELKVNEDDSMLMQALEYYDWVNQNIDRLAERYQEKNPKLRIDAGESPRIMLVARSFSSSLKTCCKHVNPEVDLFEYMYFKSKSGEKGLICKSVEIEPPVGPPTKPPEIEDQLNYITNTEMRQFCREVIGRIQNIGKDIEVTPTQWGLSLKYANRVIAYISTRRNFFYINYQKRRNWYRQSIEKKRDFAPEIIEGIKDSYRKLKGE